MGNLTINTLNNISNIMCTTSIVGVILFVIRFNSKNDKQNKLITYGLFITIGISILIGGISKTYYLKNSAISNNTDYIVKQLNENIDFNAQNKISRVEYIPDGDIENFKYLTSDPTLMPDSEPTINIAHMLNLIYDADGIDITAMNINISDSIEGVDNLNKNIILREMGYVFNTGSIREDIRFYSCSSDLLGMVEPSETFALKIDSVTLTGGLMTSDNGEFATIIGENSVSLKKRNEIIQKLDTISTKYNKDVSLLISNGIVGLAIVDIDPFNFETLNDHEIDIKLNIDLDILSESVKLISDVISIIKEN